MILRGLLLLFSHTRIPRVIGRLMLDRRVPLRAKLLLPAALLYLISPIDLVPDIIPLHGWIDDILAVLFSAALFLGMTPRDVVLEHIQGRGPSSAPDSPNQARGSGKTVIDGSYRRLEDDEQ